MTDLPSQRAQHTAAALAYFCAHMEEIRDLLRTGETRSGSLVDRLLAAIRGDHDVDEAIQLLHERLQAEGDPRGLHGGTRGTGARIAGLGTGGPSRKIYLCPQGRCARWHWADSTHGAVPACGVDGISLSLEESDT